MHEELLNQDIGIQLKGCGEFPQVSAPLLLLLAGADGCAGVYRNIKDIHQVEQFELRELRVNSHPNQLAPIGHAAEAPLPDSRGHPTLPPERLRHPVDEERPRFRQMLERKLGVPGLKAILLHEH
eukprot:3092958-Pyramimonas_sp.AAC.1